MINQELLPFHIYRTVHVHKNIIFFRMNSQCTYFNGIVFFVHYLALQVARHIGKVNLITCTVH